jgi:hypothetical protein
VTTVDLDGRTVDRVATDIEGAATAIESWARADLAEPLLAARTRPAQIEDREDVPALEAETTPPAPAIAPPRILVGLGAEGGWSSGGAVWTGARAHGCFSIRGVCMGALIAYAVDIRCCGDAAELSTERETLDILASASVPIARGRFTLAPAVALGQRWVVADRERFDGEISEDTATAHARADVVGRVRVAGDVSLELNVALGLSPLARPRLGDSDPPLAGAPRLQGWVGLGLGYGGL